MEQHTIKNGFLELTTLDYGAIIQKLMVTDRKGRRHNCVAGFEDPGEYLSDRRSFGACVGRFAGRISGSSLKVGNETYPIHSEEGVHLHGGRVGLGRRTWQLRAIRQEENPSITYEYVSPHLEEGYPGKLTVQVTYHLQGNSLRILHQAITDRPTIVNLTNHSYFKLDDAPRPDELQLQINAKQRLETDEKLLPTGKLLEVAGTEYDFCQSRALGATRLDTPYAVEPEKNPKAIAWSAQSGIRLTVESDQPAVVVFTPPDLAAICFETQNYPDAPNQPSFPSPLLNPGETYRNESFFRFDLLP